MVQEPGAEPASPDRETGGGRRTSAPGGRRRRRLGELLLSAGVVTEAAIRDAIDVAAPGERLGSVLVRLGLAGESEVADALATQLRLERVDLDAHPELEPAVVARVPMSIAERHDVLPLTLEGTTLRVAMSDPSDVTALDDLRLTAGVRRVRPVVATGEQLRRVRRRIYRSPALQDLLSDEASEAGPSGPTATGASPADEVGSAPVVQLLEQLLREAIDLGASDLHIEPYRDDGRVRFRVDGLLREGERLPGAVHPKVVSRLKLLAGLDIAERRRPQDGRARFEVAGRGLEVRVSVMPTLPGETVALRLLPRAEELLGLDELGLRPRVVEALHRALTRPQGLVLLTGPTGSGKTTTAYAALAATDRLGRNVRTLEDPVEVRWLGINQTQIEPLAGVTFATGLRHLLRQDPDVLLVGEIRDRETAQLTVEAASTGHLVIATVHTNDAPSAVARLVDLGADRFLLSSALQLVVAQRLLRRICQACAEADVPRPQLLAELELDRRALHGADLRRGAGCAVCDGSGVAGRTAIAEMVPVDAELRAVLLTRADETAVLRAAQAAEMATLRQVAVERAWHGRVTLVEALRVTPDPPWPVTLPPAG